MSSIRCECGQLVHLTATAANFRCPSCKTWLMRKGKPEATATAHRPPPARPQHHWRLLHEYPFFGDWSRVRAWFATWQQNIPNVGCSCRNHWAELVASMPPDFSSPESFFTWSVDAHNAVNKRLGKPVLSYERARLANGLGEFIDLGQQPPLEIVAVTSLSPLPKHQESQPRCLDSWKRFGLTIRAVNTAAEVELLRPLYPQVDEWIASEDQGTAYSFPTQRINAMVQQDRPFLLINSDIEIRGSQTRLLSILNTGRVGVGIRYNYSSDWRTGEREGWGIDAFLMTPEQAVTLPQLPFAIGRPMWDYWLPYHFDSIQQPMEWIGEPFFYHAAHKVHWDTKDLATGRKWIEEQYGAVENWDAVRDRWPFSGGRME